MTAENPFPLERGIKQEDLILNPQSLFADNRSEEGLEARQRWTAKRNKGELRGFVRCSDARLKTIGEGSVSLGNIAAATEPSTSLVSDRGLESLTVLSHIDGETIKEAEMPTGCGGLAAKEKIGNSHHEEGVSRYVSETIFSKDPVIQSIVTAEKLAYSSQGKPVLAATQDHLDYTIYPIAYFQLVRGQMTSVSSVRNEDIARYNPERIYENGMPTIEEGLLPPLFQDMLEENRREVRGIFEKYPDLKKLQKVQKPRVALLSTDPRSARVRYPSLSSVPGSFFKIHVPREKIGEGYQVKEDDLSHALNQLEYPISHSVEAQGDLTKPFSNTDRVIFETGDIELSRELAQKAAKKPWMKNWLKLHDRRIIIVQANEGQSNIIEEV